MESVEPYKLNSDLLIKLFSKGKQLRYRKGEVISRPDNPPTGVFYIDKGFVKIYSLTDDGEERLHIIYKENEIFPLIWVMQDLQKELYYEALSEVLVSRVSKKEFLEYLNTNPKVLFEVTERLATAFNIFSDRVDDLEITKSYPRLISHLLFLARRFGKNQNGKLLIDVPITHKDIANSIAMTRETASRDLTQLEKNNLVHYEKHFLVIDNLNKLTEELHRHKETEKY